MRTITQDTAKLRQLMAECEETKARARELIGEHNPDGSLSAPNTSRSFASGQAQGLLRALRQPQESPRKSTQFGDALAKFRDTVNRLLSSGCPRCVVADALSALAEELRKTN